MKKKILLIQPEYPYGKKQIYLGSSLLITASRLIQIGFDVTLIDFNMYRTVKEHYDYIGITVIGAPYIPSVAGLTNEIQKINAVNSYWRSIDESLPPETKILIGGQPISHIDNQMFSEIFGSKAIQIKNDNDLIKALGLESNQLVSTFEISLEKAYEIIPDSDLKKYLSHEMALFISQGCHFHCAFCAAAKGMREQFRDTNLFRSDLVYLAKKAKSFGLNKLEFYATNLDFFQNPNKMLQFLDIIADIQSVYDIKIKVRCLACMSSFLKANEEISDLGDRCKNGGLWCIGFGVDGTDPKVWKAQKKTQNKVHDVPLSLDLCAEFGIRAEVLLILGFPQDTIWTLLKDFRMAFVYVTKFKDIMLRPYLAKQYVPGNDNWNMFENKKLFSENPTLFYNVDFCMAGSKFTHPRFWHRLFSNFVFLAICGIFSPLEKCATFPLIPYSKNKVWNYFADWWNKVMPFDR